MAPNSRIAARRFVGLLPPLSACVFLAACSQPDPVRPAHASAPGAAGAAASAPDLAAPRETSGGAYFVVVTPRPPSIPLNAIFSLDVAVFRDRALTQPATGIAVHVDAGMPAHGHGMNLAPRVARTGDGRFHVEGMLMHMPGAWELYVDVLEAGTSERAKFEVSLR